MQALDTKDLRRAFGAFATGVTVVTMQRAGQEPMGFTANSFTSVSLDPPLLLVCLAHGMRSYPAFAAAGNFAVNILADDQQELSGRFASRGADKFANTGWRPGRTGSPLLDGVVAWFDCRVHELHDAGDHSILIGEVVDYAYNNRMPLGFCSGAYVRFGLPQRAIEMAHHDGQVRIGAVLECGGAILLDEDPASHLLTVPTAPRLGLAGEGSGLFGLFAAAGYDITLPFLFAVYEDGRTQFVVHRGTATLRREAAAQGRIRPVDMEAIPWERVASPAQRMMLERYLRERATNVAGIYVGTAESGDLHTVSSSRPL
jgi:flavin reductase (DIM6/NTAB) family NADH-FMN oxidoreductase RutF